MLSLYCALSTKGYEIKSVRVICIGNRFYYPDNFGILVYEKLKEMSVDFEVVEGGIGGLNLMPYFEDDKEILIIDYAKDFEKNILTKEDIEKIELNEFNHATAFLYLLKSIDKNFTIFALNKPFDDVDEYIPKILELVEKLKWN